MNLPIFVNAKFLAQPLSGVQRFASEISLYLKKQLPECYFVSPENVIQDDLAQKLSPIRIGGSSTIFWEQIALPKYLYKNGSPLLINLGNIAPVFYTNQIVTLHDVAFIRNPQWFSRKFQMSYRVLIPIIARRAKHLITVSHFSKNEIAETIDIAHENITVVPNAPSNFTQISPESTPIINDDYIFTVSSMNPRKNLITLLKAFHKLAKINPIKLVLLGDFSHVFGDTTGIVPLLNHPHIIHKTHVADSELKALYTHAKLFVYPSLYEGFGLPPLEAMSLGCPVLVSDIPPHREVCASAASYFDPLNPLDLLDKMIYALAHPKNLSLCKEQAANFSWKKSADRLISCVQKF